MVVKIKSKRNQKKLGKKGSLSKRGTSMKKKSLKKQSSQSNNISLKNPNTKIVGYCLICKKKNMVMKRCMFFENKNGSIRVKGHCQNCNTKMNTFMSGKLFIKN